MKIPFRLLGAHARKNWFRTALTIGSVFVAVLIFGMLRAVIAGMESALVATSQGRIVVSSAISLFAHLPKRIEPELTALPGVKAVTHWTWFGGTYIDESPTHNNWGRFGVDVPSLRRVYGADIDLPEDVWQKFATTRTACIVGRKLAADEKLEIGTVMPIKGNIFLCNVELQVVGIYASKSDSFDERTLFFHWDYMNEEAKKGGGRQDIVSTYTLLLDDPGLGAGLIERVDREYESSANRTLTLTERQFQAQFTQMLGNIPLFFSIIGGVVLVACLMVTANTMVLNARERVQEVGILKTLGFAPTIVAFTTLVEGVLLCLVGGGAAMALVSSLDGATLPFGIIIDVPPSSIIQGLCIAGGLGFLSGLVPAWIASRLDIVTAIRRRA